MKKSRILLFIAAVFLLCVGVVTALFLLKDREKPGDEESKVVNGVTQPAEDKTMTEENGGTLFLWDFKLPLVEPKDVTVEYLQELVRLANEIYENNDIVVLSDQIIFTNQKCVDAVLKEITYEEYVQYLDDIVFIVKGLVDKSFPMEVYYVDIVSLDLFFSGIAPFGESFLFDLKETPYATAAEWEKARYSGNEEAKQFKSRELFFWDARIIYYDLDGNSIMLFPSEEQSANARSLARR